jgi:hypothetical protein
MGIAVFDFFDDFYSITNTLDTGKWVDGSGGQLAISGGIATITTNSATARAISSISTYTQPYAMRTKLSSAHIGNNVGVELAGFDVIATSYGQFVYYSVGAAYAPAYNNYNGIYNTTSIIGWTAGAYHIQDVMRNGTTGAIFRVDNANEVIYNTGYTYGASSLHFFVSQVAGYSLSIDWALARKFQSPEPVSSIN